MYHEELSVACVNKIGVLVLIHAVAQASGYQAFQSFVVSSLFYTCTPKQ